MEYVLYIGYIMIGIAWTIYIYTLIENDPRYREGYYLEISLVTNVILWPICMAAVGYARTFLGRDTLFVDREDD